MTPSELDAETKKVYADVPAGSAFQFQAHVMVWVKILGRERARECLSAAVDICADAVAKQGAEA